MDVVLRKMLILLIQQLPILLGRDSHVNSSAHIMVYIYPY